MTESGGTVFVVDDDPEVRASLAELFAASGLRTAVFETAEHFIENCDLRAPGCMVLDMELPGMDGLALQGCLRENGWRSPVIFLTGRADVSGAVRALKAGAADFLEKPCPPGMLLERVRAALERDRVLRAERQRREQAAGLLAKLTPREREVLELVVAGRASKVIAMELGISERTVEIHRHHVLGKLDVHSLVDLVALCERAGLKRPEDA